MANCKHCSKPLVKNQNYCNNECQHGLQMARRRQALIDGKYLGKLLGFQSKSWTREVLVKEFGYHCNSCPVEGMHNGKPITLEVNHVDGDASNNVLSNLEFLCPNCHSQTPNFRALNKKSARTYRKKPL